jgi:hypothetical protein
MRLLDVYGAGSAKGYLSSMFTPYSPRPLSFLSIEEIAGYQLKVYSICYETEPFVRGRFAGAWELAIACLPQPAVTNERPGLGFVILHQGRTGDYLILCWWDRENELPTRIFLNDSGGWRPARDGESFCVWDLKVIWFEREAYVGTVLAGRPHGDVAYLAMVANGEA